MKNKGVLKFFGVISILFGAIYAVIGSLALAGTITGILPGHESMEIILIIMAYIIALLALICGITCFTDKLNICRIFSLIFGALGLISLIYLQIAQSAFNLFDVIAMVLGIAIFTIARKAE